MKLDPTQNPALMAVALGVELGLIDTETLDYELLAKAMDLCDERTDKAPDQTTR